MIQQLKRLVRASSLLCVQYAERRVKRLARALTTEPNPSKNDKETRIFGCNKCQLICSLEIYYRDERHVVIDQYPAFCPDCGCAIKYLGLLPLMSGDHDKYYIISPDRDGVCFGPYLESEVRSRLWDYFNEETNAESKEQGKGTKKDPKGKGRIRLAAINGRTIKT